MKTTKTPKGYSKQLASMLLNRDIWLKKHPLADVKIQWNFPDKIAVIGAISDAIDAHYVTANADGLSLLKALHPWHCRSEPTVLMCRGVIES